MKDGELTMVTKNRGEALLSTNVGKKMAGIASGDRKSHQGLGYSFGNMANCVL